MGRQNHRGRRAVLAYTFAATCSFRYSPCTQHPSSQLCVGEMPNHPLSTAYQLMARNTSSGSPISVLVLLTCFVVLAAVQYPLVLSWFRGIYNAPESSSLSAQPGIFRTAPSVHKQELRTIEFRDGSGRQRARERILKQIVKTKGWERNTSHPRRRVLSALVGFVEYRERMEEGVGRKRDSWKKLSIRQKEVCYFLFYTVIP